MMGLGMGGIRLNHSSIKRFSLRNISLLMTTNRGLKQLGDGGHF